MRPSVVRLWTEQILLRRSLPPPSAARRPFSSLRPNNASQPNVLRMLRSDRPTRTFASRPAARRLKTHRSSPTPDPTPHLGSPDPAPSLSQRLKKLSKQYGWLAVGVYLGLSALDFPFCFLAVRMLGTERVGHYEHVVVEAVKSLVKIPFPGLFKGSAQLEGPIVEEIREATAREEALGHDGAKVVGQNGGAEACAAPVNLNNIGNIH